VAIAIALGQVPLLLLILLPGSLYLDDLRAQAAVAGRSWWPYVVQSNGTHFAPVARSIDWLHVQLGPLSDWPAVTITVVIRVALVLAAWALLREVFGPRGLLLLPLALLAITPTLLPPTVWYRQAITSLLVVVALCIAAQQHLRYVRTGGRRPLVMALLALTFGLLTFEKAALIGPWLVILTAAVAPSAESLLDRMRRVWRAKLAFCLYAAATTAYLSIYLTGPFDKGTPGELQVRDVLTMMGRQLSEGLVPGLLGGPWRWTEASPYYGNPAAPTVLIWIGLALTGAAVAWCFRRDRRRATWAIVVFLAYYLPAALMVAAGRLSAFGDAVALTYRLWPDVAVIAVFCACLALLPVRHDVPTEAHASGVMRRGLLSVVAGALVVGSVVSTASFVDRWHANPTGAYVATLQSQLRAAGPGPVRVAPVTLPDTVLPFWVAEDYSIQDLLAPIKSPALFQNIDGPVVVPDDSGRLLPLRLREISSPAPGPDGFCGYNLGAGTSLDLPLPGTLPYFADEMVHVGVLANSATTLTVAVHVDGSYRSVVTRAPLRITAGPHRLLLRVPYGSRVSAIRIRTERPPAQVCVVRAALVVPEER
jgi:hypothetical protein